MYNIRDYGFQQLSLRQKAHFHAESAFGPCVFAHGKGPYTFIFQLPYTERQVTVRFIMRNYEHEFVQVLSDKPAKHWPKGVKYMVDVRPITFQVPHEAKLNKERDVTVSYYDAMDMYRYINMSSPDVPQIWNQEPYNGILKWKKKARAGLV